MKALAIIVIAVEILGSSWIGLGAYYQLRNHGSVSEESAGTYTGIEGIEFASYADWKAYNQDKQLRGRYPFVDRLSIDELLVACCLAFGMLGGTIFLVLRIAQGRTIMRLTRIVAIPILGLLTGFVIVLVVQFLPDEGFALVARNPIVLPGFSLLAGIFFTPFYSSIGKLLLTKIKPNE